MKKALLVSCLLTGLAVGFSSCSSTGAPANQDQAAALWESMSGYRDWSQHPGWEGWQEGKSPHGKYIRIFLNSAAAADVNSDGAIIVKENFSKQDEGSLKATTVMQKIAGFDPENEDWFWARFDASGKKTHAGRVSSCSNCHFDAGGDDFLFVND